MLHSPASYFPKKINTEYICSLNSYAKTQVFVSAKFEVLANTICFYSVWKSTSSSLLQELFFASETVEASPTESAMHQVVTHTI